VGGHNRAAAVRRRTIFPNLKEAAARGAGGAALDCIFSLLIDEGLR
jgi:hypothetical protein